MTDQQTNKADFDVVAASALEDAHAHNQRLAEKQVLRAQEELAAAGAALLALVNPTDEETERAIAVMNDQLADLSGWDSDGPGADAELAYAVMDVRVFEGTDHD